MVADNKPGWLDNDTVAYHRKDTANPGVDDRTGCGIHHTVFDFCKTDHRKHYCCGLPNDEDVDDSQLPVDDRQRYDRHGASGTNGDSEHVGLQTSVRTKTVPGVENRRREPELLREVALADLVASMAIADVSAQMRRGFVERELGYYSGALRRKCTT